MIDLSNIPYPLHWDVIKDNRGGDIYIHINCPALQGVGLNACLLMIVHVCLHVIRGNLFCVLFRGCLWQPPLLFS